MAVYQKLAKIQAEVRSLTKDKKAYGYDYVSGDKLLNVIRPRMAEMGLLLMPQIVSIESQPITYEVWNDKSKCMVSKTEVLHTVKGFMKWVDTEQGKIEAIQEPWAMVGMNNFDKGYGSALTYGERYYLLKLFHLPTDRDDVDAVSVERDEQIEKAADNAKPAYKPLSPEAYRMVVEAYVKGIKPKDGSRDYRDAFIKRTNATLEAIDQFDFDAETYSNSINKTL